MIHNSNGWTKPVKFKGVLTLGAKLMREADNHLGYEVQEFYPGEGWKASMTEVIGYTEDDQCIEVPLVMETRGLAEQLMEAMSQLVKRELRIYETVQYPVKK